MEQKPPVYFQEGIGGATSHLLALCVVCADVGELPADVEQHVVLPRSPPLHEVGGEHPRPEHDPVVLKTTWEPHTHRFR